MSGLLAGSVASPITRGAAVSRQQQSESTVSDDQLIQALADRRSPEKAKRAFQDLFATHGGLVLGYCNRILADKTLAEDVAQEVWMKVIQNADKYEARGQFRPWLLTLSRNTCFNVLRSRKALDYEESIDSETNPSNAEGTDPLTALLAESDNRTVRDLIDSLPTSQRTALSLLLIEELSYSDIAKAMGASLTAVKTYIFRARKILEQELRSRRTT
jgi:RNA polymerase sigma-70 factor (ECF subfamily)